MKLPKYIVSYTLKDAKAPLYHRKEFNTKKEWSEWFKKNKKKLYWHQFRETAPKSKLPKPIILGEFSEADYIKKIGTLQTYFETGMECTGLIFYEDGVYGGPNPDFDPSKPEDGRNFKNFHTHDGITFIETGHILRFEDGTQVGMIKDREFAKSDGYRLSFYPRGYSRFELVNLFAPENVKVTIYIPQEKKNGQG